jgi:hypothetical protein
MIGAGSRERPTYHLGGVAASRYVGDPFPRQCVVDRIGVQVNGEQIHPA